MAKNIIDKWNAAQKLEAGSFLDTGVKSEYYNAFWKDYIESFPVNFVVSKINTAQSILDVGSGPIPILHALPKTKKMVAVDPLNDSYSGKFERLGHIEYVTAAFEKYHAIERQFDIVFCINALDHTISWEDVLGRIISCMKDGGRLLLCYENTSPVIRLAEKLGYKKHLSQYHVHDLSFLRINSYLKDRDCVLAAKRFETDLNWNRIKFTLKRLFCIKKNTPSDYEKRVSVLYQKNIADIIIYGLLQLSESIFFIFFPVIFCNRVKSVYVRKE